MTTLAFRAKALDRLKASGSKAFERSSHLQWYTICKVGKNRWTMGKILAHTAVLPWGTINSAMATCIILSNPDFVFISIAKWTLQQSKSPTSPSAENATWSTPAWRFSAHTIRFTIMRYHRVFFLPEVHCQLYLIGVADVICPDVNESHETLVFERVYGWCVSRDGLDTVIDPV
jgi:hypothetical protein